MDCHQANRSKQRIFRNNDITEENKAITSERELAKTFNKHYINIVEKSSGIKPKDLSQRDKNQHIQKTNREILKSYKNHPIILQMKNFCSSSFHVKKMFFFSFCK